MMKIENEIIEKAKNNDSEAIAVIYSLTKDNVYHYLLKKTKNKEVAEDITQETYRVVIEKLYTLNKNESIMSWIYQIATNEYNQYCRKQQKISDEDINFDDIADSKLTAEEKNISEDTEQYILKIMKEKLSDVQFETFRLYAVENKSYDEIAKKLNCPLGTVKSRINKSRKILQNEIASLEKKGISIHTIFGIPMAENTVSTAENISEIELFFKKILKFLLLLFICFGGISTLNLINKDDDIIINENTEEFISDTEQHSDVSVSYISTVSEVNTDNYNSESQSEIVTVENTETENQYNDITETPSVESEIIENIEIETVENSTDEIIVTAENTVTETTVTIETTITETTVTTETTMAETTEKEEIFGEIIESGKCGENVTWTVYSNDYENATLVISGKGAMDNFSYYNRPWDTAFENINQLNEDIPTAMNTDIIIEEGVTYIGDYSFYATPYISPVSIKLPETLERIGRFAFRAKSYNWIGIQTVEISANVSYIDPTAFQCQIESFSVDENNQYYTSQDGILYSKDMSELVIYPGGKSLNGYVVPSSVESIYQSAFMAFESSGKIHPDSMKDISVTIPSTVKEFISVDYLEDYNNYPFIGIYGTRDVDFYSSVEIKGVAGSAAYDFINKIKSENEYYYLGDIIFTEIEETTSDN